MTTAVREGVYGHLPEALFAERREAAQFSPLVPGAAALDAVVAGSLHDMVMVAPSGVLERRYAIASALRALAPKAPFVFLAPKDRGGARLAPELRAFGCDVQDEAKRHHRICTGVRPSSLDDLEAALADGGPRRLESSGLWSQPGVFSWDRLDPGSSLLMKTMPVLAGRGADFGCGIGTLASAVLRSPKVKHFDLIDLDRRAIDAARRNVEDERVSFRWADLRQPDPALTKLDFVVMNPPFHDGGTEDRALGQVFIRRAAESLRTGGRLWLTANRHLPYEGVMKTLFRGVTSVVEAGGYKIYEAVR